jgi:hypothetical protein
MSCGDVCRIAAEKALVLTSRNARVDSHLREALSHVSPSCSVIAESNDYPPGWQSIVI